MRFISIPLPDVLVNTHDEIISLAAKNLSEVNLLELTLYCLINIVGSNYQNITQSNLNRFFHLHYNGVLTSADCVLLVSC